MRNRATGARLTLPLSHSALSLSEVAEQSGGERGLLAHSVREMLAPLSGE